MEVAWWWLVFHNTEVCTIIDRQNDFSKQGRQLVDLEKY